MRINLVFWIYYGLVYLNNFYGNDPYKCLDRVHLSLKVERVFSKLVCCGEKYSQLKLMNIQNNYKNFLVNSWYLNISLLVNITFIGGVVVAYGPVASEKRRSCCWGRKKKKKKKEEWSWQKRLSVVIVPLTMVDGGEELLWFERKGGIFLCSYDDGRREDEEALGVALFCCFFFFFFWGVCSVCWVRESV